MVTQEKEANYANNGDGGFQKFLFLFIAGFLMIFAGITVLIVTAAFSGGQTNFGAVVFIGPIPIIIGAGPEATLVVLFAIILAILSIIIFLTFRRKMKTYHQQG
jgi:uncharacterized membrane protein